jgi:hypothetical protein
VLNIDTSYESDFWCRLVPQEAGGRSSRSQGYNLFTVSGDVVQLEFSIDFSSGGDGDATNNTVDTAVDA